jgi:hypothetical protein
MNFGFQNRGIRTLGQMWFCLGLLLFKPSNCDAQPIEKFVHREQLLCVLKNLDKYLEVARDPVLIVLAICPQTELNAEAIGRITRNELPQPKTGTDVAADSAARFLVLSKSDLNCLPKFRSILNDLEGSLIRLPTNLCGSQ